MKWRSQLELERTLIKDLQSAQRDIDSVKLESASAVGNSSLLIPNIDELRDAIFRLSAELNAVRPRLDKLSKGLLFSELGVSRFDVATIISNAPAGAVIHLRAGRYDLLAVPLSPEVPFSCVVRHNDVHIKGSSPAGTVIVRPTHTDVATQSSSILQIVGVQRISVSGLQLLQMQRNDAAIRVTLLCLTRAQPADDNDGDIIEFRDCVIKSSNAHALIVAAHRPVVTGIPTHEGSVSVAANRPQRVVVHGCQFESPGCGIYLDVTNVVIEDGRTHLSLVVDDCTFNCCSGIRIAGGGGSTTRCTHVSVMIRNCRFVGCKDYGIECKPEIGVTLLVTNCQFDDCSPAAISVAEAKLNDFTTTISNCDITNGSTSITSRVGVLFICRTSAIATHPCFTLTQNRIRDCVVAVSIDLIPAVAAILASTTAGNSNLIECRDNNFTAEQFGIVVTISADSGDDRTPAMIVTAVSSPWVQNTLVRNNGFVCGAGDITIVV